MKNETISNRIKLLIIAAVFALGALMTGCSNTDSSSGDDQTVAAANESVSSANVESSIPDSSESNEADSSKTESESESEDKAKTQFTDKTIGADGKEMPVANGLYFPAKNEHRFTDILTYIANSQEVTITQHGIVTYAYSAVKDMLVNYGHSYFLDATLNATDIWFNNVFFRSKSKKNNNEWYDAYHIDPDRRLWIYDKITGSLENHKKWADDESDIEGWVPLNEAYCASPSMMFGAERILGIPEVLKPDIWKFEHSGTVTVNGNNYYCETYKVNFTLYEYDDVEDWSYIEGRGIPYEYHINVVFDSNGDVAFMGEEFLDDSPSYEDPTITENQAVLLNLFRDVRDSTAKGYETNLVGELSSRTKSYDQYTVINIKPGLDDTPYDIENYEVIYDVFEYGDILRQDPKTEIMKELGLI